MNNRYKFRLLSFKSYLIILLMMPFQKLKVQEKQDTIFNLFKANFYKGLPYQLLNPINFDVKSHTLLFSPCIVQEEKALIIAS